MATLEYQPQNPERRNWFSTRNLILIGFGGLCVISAGWFSWSRVTKPAVVATVSSGAMTSGSLIETTNDTGIWAINNPANVKRLKNFAEMHDLHVACFVRNAALEPDCCDFYMGETPYLFLGDVRLVSLRGSKGPPMHPSRETVAATLPSTNPEGLDPAEIATLKLLKETPGEDPVKVSENASALPLVRVAFMSAIRLRSDCVGCHDNAPVGRMVGAFEYELEYCDNERLWKSLHKPSEP